MVNVGVNLIRNLVFGIFSVIGLVISVVFNIGNFIIDILSGIDLFEIGLNII